MSPLEMMRERRAAKNQELEELLSGPTDEKRDLNEDEDAKFSALVEEIRKLDVKIDELEDTEQRNQKRAASSAAAAVATGETGEQRTGPAKVTDPPVYVRGGKNGKSFFRDMFQARMLGDRDADDRLRRHSAAVADTEQRALGNTNAAGGSGGEFAPPDWLVSDFVALARPGRATSQLYKNAPVPRGVSSVQIPKILTGTTVALQSTQNTALSQTDLTTGSVGTGFSTIGGKQVVSQQLLDQSEIDFDYVVTSDLAAAWGLTFGVQIMSGTGTGANNNSVVNGLASATAGIAKTWTQASPTVAGFYGQCASMLASFATTRYAEPTVWLMHPRRWYWLVAAADSAGRPLVVPDAEMATGRVQALNPIATNSGSPVAVVGVVGMFLGLPVVIDPNIPTNLGAGTNQDEVFLLKSDDLWAFESDPVAEVFREPYADNLGVLFRIYSYVGTILNRQANSIATLNGTGLVAPVFAS